jgi:hypothetical protein
MHDEAGCSSAASGHRHKMMWRQGGGCACELDYGPNGQEGLRLGQQLSADGSRASLVSFFAEQKFRI